MPPRAPEASKSVVQDIRERARHGGHEPGVRAEAEQRRAAYGQEQRARVPVQVQRGEDAREAEQCPLHEEERRMQRAEMGG